MIQFAIIMLSKETSTEKSGWRKSWEVSLLPEIEFKAEAWKLSETTTQYLRENYQAQNLSLRIDKKGLEKIVDDLDLPYSELMVLAIILVGKRKKDQEETENLALINEKEVDEVFFALKEAYQDKENKKSKSKKD